MCNTFMSGVDYEGQKKASDPLKMELWEVVSPCVGAGNRTLVLYQNSQCCS